MPNARAYAAFDATSPLAPYALSRREPGPHDLGIEILWSGICHSDIHQVRNEWGGSNYPMVPGHEIVGRVVSVGDRVTSFGVGDLAGVGCMVDSCRACRPCEAGTEQYCENQISFTYNSLEQDRVTRTYGGYSTFITVAERFALKIDPRLPLEGAAPLLCAGITLYSPLRKWHAGKGTRLGIVGLGGLGHMGVKLGAALGAEVTVISSSNRKREDAKRLGAHEFLVASDEAAMRARASHFDLLIDTVSADHSLSQLTELLRTDGTLVMVGAPEKPLPLPAFALIPKRRSIAGSMIGGIAETQQMLDFCAAHKIVADVETIAADQINVAYERMLKSDVRYRFVIDAATF